MKLIKLFIPLCFFPLLVSVSGCGSTSNSSASIAVTVAGTQTVVLGAQAQFTATVAGSADQTVNWSVNGVSGGDAQDGTITSAGLYTAPVTMPPSSTVKITATSTANSADTQSVTVTLQAPNAISGPQSVVLGTYAQYTATVDGSSGNLTWSVNQIAGGNAMVGTISNGLYTAPEAMPSSANITVTASDPANTSAAVSLQASLTGTAPASVPIPAVVGATVMGPVVQNSHVNGRDGTFSTLINGKSYWSFNDTAMNATNAEGANFISNSRAWTSNLDASNGIDLSNDYLDSIGMPTEFMPFTSDELAFNALHGSQSGCSTTTDALCGESYAIWPGPVIAVPNSTTGEAYHFYILILRGGTISGWNVIGIGVAHEVSGVITRPTLTPGTDHPTLMWQGSANFDGGGMVQGDTLYMLGCGQGNVFGYPMCEMAKVPLADVLTPSAWTYYNSTTQQWGADPTQATVLFYGGAGGNELFFNRALNEYMVIYSETYSNDVMFRVAPTPWGPWSSEQKIFTGVASIGSNNAFDYAALAHPEFQEQGGLVQYVTYVQDDADLGFLGQNIQLVRVTFAPQ